MVNSLDYTTPTQSPKVATLVESDGQVQLILPAVPRWLRMLVCVSAVASSTFIACEITYLVWRVWHFKPSVGLPLRVAAPAFVAPVLLLTYMTLSAVFLVVKDQRIGHLPRILSISDGKLTWASHGILRMKERHLQIQQVVNISIDPVSDIFRRKCIFRLRIDFENRRRFAQRFATSDPRLPDRIVDAFRRAVASARTPLPIDPLTSQASPGEGSVEGSYV